MTQSPDVLAADDPSVSRPQHQLGRFSTYAAAEKVVDQLSDAGFPVRHLRITGDGLRSVEQVTHRQTRARAALTGLATGVWAGLAVGLLLSLYATGPATLSVVLGSASIGAVFGTVFGFVSHWTTSGRRDFTSTQTLQADSYTVTVDATHAARATEMAGAL